MAKGKLIDQFDQAVEALMSKPSKPAAPDAALRACSNFKREEKALGVTFFGARGFI